MYSSMKEKTQVAHTWWLASEIIRRHRGLELSTCESTMGLDETLGIFESKGKRLLAFLSSEVPNRAVVDGDSKPGWAFGWDAIMGLTPREAVAAIEAKMGIFTPRHALETTETSLTYRLISKIIGSHVWTSDTWEAYSAGYYDAESNSITPTDALDEFPTALDKHESTHGRDISGRGPEGFWVLRRNGEEVFVLDHDALLHFASNRIPEPLMARFNSLGRNIDALASSVLKEFES